MLPPYTTFDTIHDQAQPTRVLRAIYNSLSSDLMRDIAASSALHENIDNALAPALYSISTIHCMTVSPCVQRRTPWYNGEWKRRFKCFSIQGSQMFKSKRLEET
jgi:hypothetical protein